VLAQVPGTSRLANSSFSRETQLKTTKTAPLAVTCPYCKRAAYQLTGKCGDTQQDRTRYGCDNAYYFVYPEPFGYEPVTPRREAA
jgi:hypothetical protein